MKAILHLILALNVGTALSQQATPAKLITLEKIEIGKGLVSDEVISRFALSAPEVESRLKGAFAANLASQLSSSKEVNLAAREESLAKLMKEWEIAEKLGNPDSKGTASSIPGVDKADYIATATLTDLVASRETLILGGKVAAAKWHLMLEASLELVDVNTGRKLNTITERVEESGQSRGNANFNDADIQRINRELASAIATRIVDSHAPIRIVAIRGDDFIIDRGKAANVKVGDKYTLMEPAMAPGFEDAGFPVGTATVTQVKEKTSNLRIERANKDVPPTGLHNNMQVMKISL